jgi:hypothetical protein
MSSMDLPVNFPLGTRFWHVTIDAFADLPNGEFMRLDGSIASGHRADRLRRQAERGGVEISEETFRQVAPLSLTERLNAIDERAKRDPKFRKALAAAVTVLLLEQCERVGWDALRNAPDPEDQRAGADLLLKIMATKQNMGDQ